MARKLFDRSLLNPRIKWGVSLTLHASVAPGVNMKEHETITLLGYAAYMYENPNYSGSLLKIIFTNSNINSVKTDLDWNKGTYDYNVTVIDNSALVDDIERHYAELFKDIVFDLRFHSFKSEEERLKWCASEIYHTAGH